MKGKLLATLALVLLVSSASEGRILTKCELKSQLEAALGGNQGGSGPAPVTNRPGIVTVPGNVPAPVTNRPGIVTVPGTVPAPGNVTVPGNMTVPGTVPAPGNVTVPGNMTVPGTVPAPGNVTVPANMTVPGTVPAPGNVTVPGNMTVPGKVSVPRTVPRNAAANLLSAQIVCSVERLSRFNTGLVTTIQEDPRPPMRPQQRPDERSGRHIGKGKRSLGSGPRRQADDSSSSESSEDNVTTRLLGIFQLSDRVACNSGSGQSLNICQINCRALTDDDIRDDIACLKTLLNIKINEPLAFPVKECRNVNPAHYFAQCR